MQDLIPGEAHAAEVREQCPDSTTNDEDARMEKVTSCLRESLATLREVWAEIGLNSEQRLVVCNDILLDVESVMHAKIADASETKAQTILKIRLSLRRLTAIYKQLGESPPNTDFVSIATDDADIPASSLASVKCKIHKIGLLLQLETLEGLLAVADERKTERIKVFESKTDELRELLLEQFGDLEPQMQACLDLSGETDLSEARAQLLQEAIATGRAAREARAKSINESVHAMNALWLVLGIDEESHGAQGDRWSAFDAMVRAGGAALEPSTVVLESANERLASLEALQDVRREAAAALLSSLKLMWTRLQTPDEEQAAYSQEHAGIRLMDIQHHEATLAELEKTLQARLPALISESALRLHDLHMATLEELDPPSLLDGNSVSLKVLEQLEQAIASTESRLERRQAVLALIERRDAILKEAAELKHAGQDPARLLDKSAGSFRARQQEERRRNMVSKELPRVTDKLRKAIAEWEEAAGEAFIYLSRPYTDIMMEQRLEEERELEGDRQRRDEERQRIKAKRTGTDGTAALAVAPASSPRVGHVLVAGGMTPKSAGGGGAGNAGAERTPKVRGHDAAGRARSSVMPPKSPGSGLRSGTTPSSGAGARKSEHVVRDRDHNNDKTAEVKAATGGKTSKDNKENADGNFKGPTVCGGQNGAVRQGLFSQAPAPASDGAPGRQNEEAEAEADGEDAQEAAGMQEGAGQFAAEGLRCRLADLRCRFAAAHTPCAHGEDHVHGAGATVDEEGAEGEDGPEAAEGRGGEGVGDGAVEEEPGAACGAEEVVEEEEVVVPFARWVSSGCPIGSKARVSSFGMPKACVSTPLAAVREGSSEGALSANSGTLSIDAVEESGDCVGDGGAEDGEGERARVLAEEGRSKEDGLGDDSKRAGGASGVEMVHDYLGDRYYTDEERVEIRRELVREMEDRKDELAAAAMSSKIRFRKGEVLGAGSFGQVFLGLNESNGELLAVKEVDCSRAGEAAIRDLESEIEMLQLLRHPNIVAYYGVQRGSGVSVLVEYCAGGSIASVIANFGALNETVVRCYTRQILQGLDYLHKHCIVHRDVKCANVLLDSDGNVKVADFGASKNLSQLNGEGHQMSMKGTPFFMAPEVVLQQDVGRQSDLWSVGCCVVEMGTSKPPFSGQFSNVAALLFHIARNVAPPLLPDVLSQECHEFCALCFRRDPKERPSARRLLRHPFVANWSAPHGAGADDVRRHNLSRRQTRTSALF